MKPNPEAYKITRKSHGTVRVVTILPEELVGQIDAWAGPMGMRSRTEAIKHLLNAALQNFKEKGAEPLTA